MSTPKTYSVPSPINASAETLGKGLSWQGLSIPPGTYTTSDPNEQFFLDSAPGVVCTAGPAQSTVPVWRFSIPAPGINAQFGFMVVAGVGLVTTDHADVAAFLLAYPGVTLVAQTTRPAGNASEAYNGGYWNGE